MSFRRVEFSTFDGVILRGNFYPAKQPNAPCVIMTQGLALLKEHFIDKFAEKFEERGISSLIYDHRSWGSSDGIPRGEYNMWKQAEDYQDAVSFVCTLKGEVDPSKICIWGIGHSGGISILAASQNPYVAAVILVMPMTSGSEDVKNFPHEVMHTAWADRQENIGKHTTNPTYLQLWPVNKEMAMATDGSQSLFAGSQVWEFVEGSEKRSSAAGTPWSKKMTAQSFYHIAKTEPRDFIHRIAPRPLLYMAAQTDILTGTLESHKETFSKAGEPKEFVVLKDHHLGTYMYDNATFDESAEKQVEFLERLFIDSALNKEQA